MSLVSLGAFSSLLRAAMEHDRIRYQPRDKIVVPPSVFDIPLQSFSPLGMIPRLIRAGHPDGKVSQWDAWLRGWIENVASPNGLEGVWCGYYALWDKKWEVCEVRDIHLTRQ